MRIDTVKPQKIVFVFTFGHGVNAHGFIPTAQFGLRHAPNIDFIVPSTSNYNSTPFTTLGAGLEGPLGSHSVSIECVEEIFTSPSRRHGSDFGQPFLLPTLAKFDLLCCVVCCLSGVLFHFMGVGFKVWFGPPFSPFPWTALPLDFPSPGPPFPRTALPLDRPSPGPPFPWTALPLDRPSPGPPFPWTALPLDRPSPDRPSPGPPKISRLGSQAVV